MLRHRQALFCVDLWAALGARTVTAKDWTVLAFDRPPSAATLLAITRRLDRLAATVAGLVQAVAALQQPPRPALCGFFPATDLAAVLRVPAERRQAFVKQVHRRRAGFGSAVVEIANPAANSASFLFDAGNDEIRSLARRYGADC